MRLLNQIIIIPSHKLNISQGYLLQNFKIYSPKKVKRLLMSYIEPWCREDHGMVWYGTVWYGMV